MKNKAWLIIKIVLIIIVGYILTLLIFEYIDVHYFVQYGKIIPNFKEYSVLYCDECKIGNEHQANVVKGRYGKLIRKILYNNSKKMSKKRVLQYINNSALCNIPEKKSCVFAKEILSNKKRYIISCSDTNNNDDEKMLCDPITIIVFEEYDDFVYQINAT